MDDGTVGPGACGGTEEPGRAVGVDVLAEIAGGGWASRAVGTSLSSGIVGAGSVGVTDKEGVADEMTGDGGRVGVSLPATTGGTDGVFAGDCWGGRLRLVGLFIVSREPLMPLKDDGLMVPGNE